MKTSADGAAPDRAEPTFLQLATVLLGYRKSLFLTTCLVLAVTIVLVLAVPRKHTSVASFVPESVNPSQLSTLASLSAQLGLGNILEGTAFGMPDFYKELLQTREILGEIADTRFHILGERGDFEGTLAEYWKLPPTTPDRRRDRVIRRLRGRLSAHVNQRIQLVTVEATTTSPHLSKAIVERALELVNQFNQEKRQSHSAQERRFIGTRLEEARRELWEAEEAVARFMEQNRDFRNSPALNFQYERLQRDAGLRQSLYATLSQSHEETRINEVRDTPVITVVQRAELPPRPDSRYLLLKIGLAVFTGGFLGVLGALLREFIVRESPASGDVVEFRILLAELRAELRRPWQLLTFWRR